MLYLFTLVTELKESKVVFAYVLQDSTVKGSVLIRHQLLEGKHHYEVEDVVKYKSKTRMKMFIRYDL